MQAISYLYAKVYRLWKRLAASLLGGIAVFLIGCTAAYGTDTTGKTIIVDNRAVNAADNNPGTRARPLKTISAGAKIVKPGDTVLVRPGIYREAVNLTVSGTEGRPITFQSETPGAAIVEGADITTNIKPEMSGIWSFAAPDLAPTPGGFAPGQQVYIDGAPLEFVTEIKNLTPGTYALDYDRKRVFIAPLEEQQIGNSEVAYARRAGLFATTRPIDNIHIKGFTLIHGAGSFLGPYALLVSGQHWLVENNHILWSSYAGIRIERTNHCIVRNNVVEWSGATGLGGFANANLLLEKNILTYGNWRRQDTGFDGGAGKLVFTYDTIIKDNECAYNNGWGIWLDIACGDVLYQGNISHDNAQNAGLFSEISWKTRFVDNIVYNNDQGIMVGETSGCDLSHNIFYNNQTGLYMRSDNRRMTATEYGYQSIESFHKLLTDNIPSITPARADVISEDYKTYWIIPAAHPEKDNRITDNLFIGNRAAYYEWRQYGKPSPIDTNISNFSDNNIFSGTRQDALFLYSDGSYPSLEAWRTVSDRDQHSTVVDANTLAARLPDWAKVNKKKSTHWNQKMRSWSEIANVNLGLIKSPTAAILNGRLMRSTLYEPVEVGDPQVKAALLTVEGQRTLAVWTTQIAARRSLRLRLTVPKITYEDAYLRKTQRDLPDGTISLTAAYLPVFLRGVGKQIAPAPAVTLTPQPFNMLGKAVPVRVTFTNDHKTAATLSAEFIPGADFQAYPSRLTRDLKPHETYTTVVQLKPVGTTVTGPTQVKIQGQIGAEIFTQVAVFSVGEGSGTIPFAAIPQEMPDVTIGRLLDVKAQIAAIGTAEQIATGDKTLWTGPSDLSGTIYAAWTTDALLIAVDVTDNSVVPAPQSAEPWSADSVEVFVDGRPPAFQYQSDPTEGCYQVVVSPGTSDTETNTRVLAKTELQGVQTTATRTARGYFVTVRLPLSRRNFPGGDFSAGRPVKLAVLVSDKDDSNQPTRKYEIGWGVSPHGANYNDTSGWKTLLLDVVPIKGMNQ